MTHQQELELLAEWLGIEVIYDPDSDRFLIGTPGIKFGEEWNPSPEGNDTDFLNMVAGRVRFHPTQLGVAAHYFDGVDTTNICASAFYADHNNEKVAAMKHAAYQVCLMAAGEWKGE